MKLFLDENLSRRLVPVLEDHYPGTTQVALEGLETASDQKIWDYAKEEGYVLVTRDADFYEKSLLYGPPPHVIWIKLQNPKSSKVAQALIAHKTFIEESVQDGVPVVEIS